MPALGCEKLRLLLLLLLLHLLLLLLLQHLLLHLLQLKLELHLQLQQALLSSFNPSKGAADAAVAGRRRCRAESTCRCWHLPIHWCNIFQHCLHCLPLQHVATCAACWQAARLPYI